MSVAGKRWVWVESMGVVVKEVYRFFHITYPYSSCSCSFWKQYVRYIHDDIFYFSHRLKAAISQAVRNYPYLTIIIAFSDKHVIHIHSSSFYPIALPLRYSGWPLSAGTCDGLHAEARERTKAQTSLGYRRGGSPAAKTQTDQDWSVGTFEHLRVYLV